MEAIQDWASYLLRSGYLTPAYLRPFTSAPTTIHKYLSPIIANVTAKPDLASIALTLLILFLSLKLLNMLWQAVMFWVRLATRILFWGSAVVFVLWLVNRGVDGAVEDVGYWGRLWKGEYVYYKEQAEQARLANAAYKGGSARNKYY